MSCKNYKGAWAIQDYRKSYFCPPTPPPVQRLYLPIGGKIWIFPTFFISYQSYFFPNILFGHGGGGGEYKNVQEAKICFITFRYVFSIEILFYRTAIILFFYQSLLIKKYIPCNVIRVSLWKYIIKEKKKGQRKNLTNSESTTYLYSLLSSMQAVLWIRIRHPDPIHLCKSGSTSWNHETDPVWIRVAKNRPKIISI